MRVIFNEDNTHFGYYCFANNIEITEKVLKDFIYVYKNSDVTDFMLNVGGMCSTTESDILQSYCDKYEAEEECGQPVDFKDTFVKAYHRAMRVNKLDMYKIWIDTLREINIKPWLSFRMNDIHNSTEGPNPITSEYTLTHPEHWIVKNRPQVGYFDRCLDYALPEVRERMYEYIKEQLTRYDVDGIELDFGRESCCFAPGQQTAGIPIMLEFLEQIKELVDEISKVRSKKLDICLIIPASPINAYNQGFDVTEIVNRGLVDIVVAAPRWTTINTDIPLQIWRKLLGDRVQLGAMQQLLVNTTYGAAKLTHSDLEMAFGQAAAFATCGADFVYLYNCMYSETPFEYAAPTSIIEPENNKYIINNIGKTENISKWTRRCPLTFDDSVGLYDARAERLPDRVTNRYAMSFKIVTGTFLKEQKAYVILGFKTPVNPDDLRVWVNDIEAKYTTCEKHDPYVLPENAYTFEFCADVDDTVIVEVISQKDYIAEYVEVLIVGENN